MPVRCAERDGTTKTRAAVRRACEFAEQLGIVRRIAARFTRISRRENAGRIVKCDDLQTRIIRKRPEAGGRAKFTRFFERIALEGVGVFHNIFGQARHVIRRHQFERWQRENLTDFFQLVLVACRDE